MVTTSSSFGSSASRRPSPIRLMASTVIRMARPGNVTTHQARRMNSRAVASMVPHSGVGGWAPMPRKPSAAASRMALEKDSVACTISGARQFGRIVLHHQPTWPAPATLRGDHIFAGLFRHHCRAGEPREMRLQHQRDREHGVEQARPEDRHQHQRKQQRREGQDDVHDAHDQRVDPAAEIAGDKPERRRRWSARRRRRPDR